MVEEPLRISVVVPAWNSERFLPEALASIARQHRRPMEVIVVDDASDDATAALAESAGARVIRQAWNGGPGASRNAGIEAAAGDLVAFLDADDWWQPDHLERVAPLLEATPGAVLACGRVRGRMAAEDRELPDTEAPFSAIRMLWRRNPVLQSAAIVRRSAILEAGGYRPEMRFAEDYDLWFRLARRGPFVCSSMATVNYRAHPDQLSARKAAMLKAAWDTRNRAWAQVAPTLDSAERALIEADLRAAWEEDLRTAWHFRGPEPLSAVMAIEVAVPGIEEIRHRWIAQARWLRAPWLVMARCWDRLPAGFRDSIRRARHDHRFPDSGSWQAADSTLALERAKRGDA
ncbi:MAG TPA: glycosyltransferase family A protein [Gemmatimonadales bacterium]|nr:glycosyltransferase family A protein [Gemmatimonadales bacterium]